MQLINNALDLNLDVPQHDNIYISRRTQHNPKYSKDLLTKTIHKNEKM